MLRWLLAQFRRPTEAPDPPPLDGLAGEAALLLAAYEGMGHGTATGLRIDSSLTARPPGPLIAATEAELDAAERARWMLDANDWANRALASVRDGDDPYRETPRPDARLREVGAHVRDAVHADAADQAARALGEYVQWARARAP